MARGINSTSKSDDEDPTPPTLVERDPSKRRINRPFDLRNLIGSNNRPVAGAKRPPEVSTGDRHVKRQRSSGSAPTVEEVPDADLLRQSPPPLSGAVIEEIASNPPPKSGRPSAVGTQEDPMEIASEDDQPRRGTRGKSSQHIPDLDDSDESDDDSDKAPQPSGRKTGRKTHAPQKESRTDPKQIDGNGLLADLGHIQAQETASLRDDKTRDIRAHFSEARSTPGVKNKIRDCNICKKRQQPKSWFTDEHTTLRRHMESMHEPQYMRWCKENNFDSMLPKATKARRNAETAAKATQSTLDDHLEPMPEAYSEEVFRQAVLEWLAATDQPLEAVEHPTFRRVINLACQARNGVTLPSRKATRKELVNMLNKYFTDLAERLKRSKGKVSATCDSWSADNFDSYFGVTAHWIEESSPGIWDLKASLIGFVNIRHSHNGRRLGQALYKVFVRVKIAHNIGWITCDNATNNNTMMKEAADRIQLDGDESFIASHRRIRCLAHIINLATQALLKARSEAKFRGKDVRDEAALVRNVAIKERTSDLRITRFHKIQADRGVQFPRNLLRDMTVRWSSTKIMLDRAVAHRQDIKKFVHELEDEEQNEEKHAALTALQISSLEWKNVDKLLDLLSLSDDAQIAFSAEQYPTLYNAVPALTLLLTAWEKRLLDTSFSEFHAALRLGVKKLAEYKDSVQDSLVDAYWISMVLHPEYKFGPEFVQFWGARTDLLKADMETKFKERYDVLHKKTGGETQPVVKKTGLSRLRADAAAPTAGSSSTAPAVEAWRVEYERFINVQFDLPDGMSLVTWWGMHASQLPTWASIAADYLAIMASSVSSERAFSSAGITITKRRNRLKGDIVEALQVLKCALRNELLVRAPAPSSVADQDFCQEDSDGEEADLKSIRCLPELVIELSDSEDALDEDLSDTSPEM